MARKPRIEYEGALYHVICRGNQRQRLFRTQDDFIRYLDFLSNYKARYHFYVHAYVLMTNHLHLLIETGHVPLSKILQGITQSYTAFFNRRHKTSGHLFQGRYKAIVCDKDAYLLTLVKYIHLNPIRAKSVKGLRDYPWSSHHAYLKKSAEKGLVDTDFVLGMFSLNRPAAIRQYDAFVNDELAVEKAEIYGTVDQRLLGDDRFVEEVKGRVQSEIKSLRRQRQYSLADIAKTIETASGVLLKDMQSETRGRNAASARSLFSSVAKEFAYKNVEIARFLQKDEAAVSNYLNRMKASGEEVEKIIVRLQN